MRWIVEIRGKIVVLGALKDKIVVIVRKYGIEIVLSHV